MQPHILPTQDLASLYRYAILLAGAPEPAQAVILEVFADAGEKIHHFRTGKSCAAWLAAKVRARLLKKSPETLQQAATEKSTDPLQAAPAWPSGTFELVTRFSRIPEPGRSALALLYVDTFTPQEIAQILQISLDELAAAIDSARALLGQMEAVEQTLAATTTTTPADAAPADAGDAAP